MSRFNLVTEPWIVVLADNDGRTEEVSLKQLFANAKNYHGLAGDTKTQDFAVMRILLAILHTVFSRLDAEGKVYDYVSLNERYQPHDDMDVDDIEDYESILYETVACLMEQDTFSKVVTDYLEAWQDRFYLLDEKYPFMQVTAADVDSDQISKSKPSNIAGKNINRTISESNNKIALFSPRYAFKDNKERLSEAELARWLITYQAYTGLADKVIFGTEKYKSSKGWLFDLGGIFLQGDNLYETLVLNLVLVHPVKDYVGKIEKPCWEYTSAEVLQSYFPRLMPDNLAELYTIWSRAIYIDPETDFNDPFSFDIVKLPDLEHEEAFIEPMTVWRFNSSGDSKDKFTPRKHPLNQSVWRSFGLITMPSSRENEQRKPGIMEWIGEIGDLVEGKQIDLIAVSMQDDGNATSWVPVDEITDELKIDEFILTDTRENQWIPIVNDAVEHTKEVINKNFRRLIADIAEIRNIDPNLRSGFISRKVSELYYVIDTPFREWLASIKPDDNKDQKVLEWRRALKALIIREAEKLLNEVSSRDYLGIVKNENVKNIATVFNSFIFFLNRAFDV